MPLIPTTDLWRATIEGAPHLVQDFTMPAGSDEDQARYRIWSIWSHARANGSSDPERPIASRWLRLERIAVGMVAQPAIEAAWSEAA